VLVLRSNFGTGIRGMEVSKDENQKVLAVKKVSIGSKTSIDISISD
jgi:hypothetical protein